MSTENKTEIFTAQRMRDVAQCLRFNSPTKLTSEAADLLFQAAALMEREKKYEYTLRYSRLNGVSKLHDDDFNIIKDHAPDAIVLRREVVGEWEVFENA